MIIAPSCIYWKEGVFGMRRFKILISLSTIGLVIAFIFVSNILAPVLIQSININPYYLLNWGAPALFYENVDSVGAKIKLEPWRLLGLQLPAFAGIQPEDWVEANTPEPEPEQPPAMPTTPNTGIVAIYHSHASESYVPTSNLSNTDNFEETVVAIGDEIKNILVENDIEVVHSREYHDREYRESYKKSRVTAQDMLRDYSDIALLMDVHRDGIGENSATGKPSTTATVQGRKAGKIMFVISSAHESWEQNNRIANDLHNILEDKYPGLSRGILIKKNSTYNQDLHAGAILVEVGGHWNSLDEAMYGAQLFADALIDYFGGGM